MERAGLPQRRRKQPLPAGNAAAGGVLLSRFSDEDSEWVKEVSLSPRHAGAQGKIKVSLFTVGPDNRPQKFREEILSAEEGAVILSLPQFSVILAEIEPYLPA